MSEELFEKLATVYGQIYELTIIIGQLIERKQFSNIDNFLEMKGVFYNTAVELLNEIGEDADLSRFYDICEKIQTQESANISSLTLIRDGLKKDIQKANKKSKLVKAYSNVETKQGNLLDMRE